MDVAYSRFLNGLFEFIRGNSFERLIARFRVAHLATFSHSGGDPEFRQDIGLEQDPSYDYEQENPETHVLTPFLYVFFEGTRHTAVF